MLNQQSRSYIVLPAEVLADKSLTPVEKLVLARMTGFTVFFEAATTTAELLGVSVDAVRKAKQKLEKIGYIKVVENHGHGKKYIVSGTVFEYKPQQTPLKGVLSPSKQKDDKMPVFDEKNESGVFEAPITAKYDGERPQKVEPLPKDDKKDAKNTIKDVLNAVKSEKMKEVLTEWVKYKKERGDKMNVGNLLATIKQLKELADNDTDRAFIVRQAIIGGFGSFKKYDKKDLPATSEKNATPLDITEKMEQYRKPISSLYTGELEKERLTLLKARAKNQISKEEFHKKEALLKEKALKQNNS